MQLCSQIYNVCGSPNELSFCDAFWLAKRFEQGAVGLVFLCHVSHVSRHQHVYLGAHAVSVVAKRWELRAFRLSHPPVGDHAAAVAPLAAKDRSDKVVVVVAPEAVDLVV